MKPAEDQVCDKEQNVTGDVIGDTAYSERFVLKILLKLANLDTLKDEIQEKSFEDDLCTLWDMTAERDVVLFLQKHDVLKLLNFALPAIDSPRIIEIVLGIIGNMCCVEEVVDAFIKMDMFLCLLLEYVKCDDSLVLVQVMRLVNSSMYSVKDDVVPVWLDLFQKIDYASSLYFVLKNSSHKGLLITALENLNTVFSYCNTEKNRVKFFDCFVTSDALDSLSSAFTELTVKQKDLCEKEELERVLLVSLQIVINLIGFDKSIEMYKNNKVNVTLLISTILSYYENKVVDQKEIDSDLVDIIDSIHTVVNIIALSETCNIDKYFLQCYSMWKALKLITNSDKNGSANFEEDDKEQLQEFTDKMEVPLCTMMGLYISQCTETNLLTVLETIVDDYDIILGSISDETIHKSVFDRSSKLKTRLKENVNS